VESAVKYMLLIYTNPENWAALGEAETKAVTDEYFAFSQQITQSGEFVAGDPLQGPDTATAVRVRDGRRAVSDGPYVETKEHLAGYYIVDCPTLDRAIELAAQIPDARFAAVEVRPVADFG
jgi:hypothetical protein